MTETLGSSPSPLSEPIPDFSTYSRDKWEELTDEDRKLWGHRFYKIAGADVPEKDLMGLYEVDQDRKVLRKVTDNQEKGVTYSRWLELTHAFGLPPGCPPGALIDDTYNWFNITGVEGETKTPTIENVVATIKTFQEFVALFPIRLPGDDGKHIRSAKLPNGRAQIARFFAPSKRRRVAEVALGGIYQDKATFVPDRKYPEKKYRWHSATTSWEALGQVSEVAHTEGDTNRSTGEADVTAKNAQIRKMEEKNEKVTDFKKWRREIRKNELPDGSVTYQIREHGNYVDLLDDSLHHVFDNHGKEGIAIWDYQYDGGDFKDFKPLPEEAKPEAIKRESLNKDGRQIEKLLHPDKKVTFQILEKGEWVALEDESEHRVSIGGKEGRAIWDSDLNGGEFKHFSESKGPAHPEGIHAPDAQAQDVLTKVWNTTLDYKTRRVFEKRRGVIFERGKRVGPEAVEAMIKAQEQFHSLPWWQRYGLSGALIGGGASGGVLGALAITGILALPAFPAALGGAVGASMFRLVKHNLDRRNATGQGNNSFYSRNPTTTAAIIGALAGGVGAMTSQLWWSGLASAGATTPTKGWFSSLLDWFTGGNDAATPPAQHTVNDVDTLYRPDGTQP